MILNNHHKRAARYLLVGMRPVDIAKRMPPRTQKDIERWRNDLDFKAYMMRIEKRYMALVDRDIEHCRRAATARLQEILDIPYDSPQFELTHFEWAVNKVFALTTLREKVLNVNQQLELRDGKAATTPAQKQALKDLLAATQDPDRYMPTRQGEA